MKRLRQPSLDWLLVFVPVSIAADLLGQTTVVFITSALAIVPLAGIIGRSTDQVARRVGSRLGGLMNATLGNITELIVCILLINASNFPIVKASLIGSILGNLLLVLGLSFVVGGIHHKEQTFSSRAAGVHSASLLLAVAGLLMPALLILTTPEVGFIEKEVVSGVVAIVLILLYVAALVFTQITHPHLFRAADEPATPTTMLRRSIVMLVVSALLVGVESELLVSSLEPALVALHLPAIFVGLILIPIIGNAAEHASAVYFAAKDRVDLTLGFARIQRSLLRLSRMLTRISPSCQSYQVATVIGKPSGLMQAITAGWGFLRNSSTRGGRSSGGTAASRRGRFEAARERCCRR
jgi:Ca2+:H+ antiporter